MSYNYESLVLEAVKKRVFELKSIKTDRDYWLMKDAWIFEIVKSLSISFEEQKQVAKELVKASVKFLKIVYIDRLYHYAIRKPIINKLLKELQKDDVQPNV